MADWGTLGKRVRWARERAKLTQEELAAESGASQALITKIESGDGDKVERTKFATALARALNVPVEWLAEKVGSPELRPHPRLRPIVEWTDQTDLDPAQHVILPRLEVRLAAGRGRGVVQEDAAPYPNGQAFRADYVRRKGWSPKTHFSMYVKGVSMEPTIPDGASVVINIADKTIKSGLVYAVKIDDELILKRLHKLPGGVIRVESDNASPRYKAFEVLPNDENGFEVIGRAVNMTSDL